MKVCYLAQFRHLIFHAELTVKHHSNVASDGSRLEDAVTDDDISQSVLASRARCSVHKHFKLYYIQGYSICHFSDDSFRDIMQWQPT